MINKNRNRQAELVERFWSSVPRSDNGARLLGMIDSVRNPKARSEKKLEGPFRMATIGDISYPDDSNAAFVNIINDNAGKILMTYYERKVSWDCDGKLRIPSEYTFRTGPCQYNYPDGQLAALELYEDVFDHHYAKGAIVGQALRDRGTDGTPQKDQERPVCVYFDPQGRELTQPEFDVVYRREIEKAGLGLADGTAFEYAPRIEHYNAMVRDIHMEITAGGDRFSAADVRELWLDGKPDSYLDMMANDIRKLDEHLVRKDGPEIHRLLPEGHREFLDKQIRVYVYGEIGDQTKHIENRIRQSYEEFGIDASMIRREKREDGRTVETIGDPDNKSHVIIRDRSGKKVEEGFMVRTFWGRDNIGPAYEYYPDGKVARMSEYGYRTSAFKPPMHPMSDYHIDNRGRLTSFHTASAQCDEAWRKAEENEKTKKARTGMKM